MMSHASIHELQYKLEYIEKLLYLNNETMWNNINLTWAILGVVVAVLGAALYFLTCNIISKSVTIEMERVKRELTKGMSKMQIGTWFENLMLLSPDSTYEKAIPLGIEADKVKLELQAGAGNLSLAMYEVDKFGFMLRLHNSMEFDKLKKTFFGKSILLNDIKLNKDKLVLSFKNVDKENSNLMNVLVRWEAIRLGDYIM